MYWKKQRNAKDCRGTYPVRMVSGLGVGLRQRCVYGSGRTGGYNRPASPGSDCLYPKPKVPEDTQTAAEGKGRDDPDREGYREQVSPGDRGRAAGRAYAARERAAGAGREGKRRKERKEKEKEQQEKDKQERERTGTESGIQEPSVAGHSETQTEEQKASEPGRCEAVTLQKDQQAPGFEEKKDSGADTIKEETSESSGEPENEVQGERRAMKQ